MTDGLDDLLRDARQRLAGAQREILGERVEPRRILGFARSAKVVAVGSAWHLGALLLTDDALLATGEIVRARHDAVRGYTAESQRRRSDLAAAAVRGGIAEGMPVHVGWHALALDPPEDPLGGPAEHPTIRWSRSGARMPLARYLDERVELLLHPLPGAN